MSLQIICTYINQLVINTFRRNKTGYESWCKDRGEILTLCCFSISIMTCCCLTFSIKSPLGGGAGTGGWGGAAAEPPLWLRRIACWARAAASFCFFCSSSLISCLWMASFLWKSGSESKFCAQNQPKKYPASFYSSSYTIFGMYQKSKKKNWNK